MPISEKKIQKKQALRKTILDFAENVASTEGWEAVTMRRISAEIKYSLPVIYDYFKNKEEIISTLAVKGYTILLDELKNIVENGQNNRQISIDLAKAYIEFAQTHKAFYLAMYGQEGISSFMPGNPKEAERVFDFIQNWLKNLVVSNEAKIPDTWETTKLIWATLHGLIALHNINQINDDKISIDQVVIDFINLLLDKWEVKA